MKKKRLASLACVLLLTAALLCGCGSSAPGTAAAAGSAQPFSGERNAVYDTTESLSTDSANTAAQSAPTTQSKAADNEEKLIYTAELNMETTGFDAATDALTKLVADCGGYFASSSVSNGGDGYRYGSYTVRVPAEKFDAFLKQAGKLCQVTNQSAGTEDVSEAYYDTAGRLKTQQTKLKRLQELLSKAAKMEDIITIESAISETEDQIESLSGEIQHYDALVNDATVNISLNEVYRLSGTSEPATGFGGRLSGALSSGWQGFLRAMQSLLVALAYGWVWVLLIVAAAVVLVRRTLKKRARKAAPTPLNPSGKAAPTPLNPSGKTNPAAEKRDDKAE